MRIRSSTRRSGLQLRLRFLPVLTVLVFFAPCLGAQNPCPDGSDPDALGCAGLQSAPSPTVGAPSNLSLQEKPQDRLPGSEPATEPSATGSVSNGARLSESPLTRKAKTAAETHDLTPEPLTEFQNFVLASTGQVLPLYGAKFFTTQPASFGPIDHGPAPAELLVGADDELRIRVWGQVNFSANLRVSRGGDIYIPKVGAVHVAGIPFSAIPDHLKNAMSQVYRNFDLSVDLGDIHTIQIYVAGMARQPGEYTVSALSSMVDAVFSTGGPSAAGSMRHVQLKRGGKVLADFDLYALLVHGDKSGDMSLQPGDVLYIPAPGAQVALMGSVRQPAIYELRGEESIEQLVETAGGKTAIAAGAHLYVDRIEDHARRRAFEVAMDSTGLATVLADGDIVRIDPIVSIYHDAVTLRGAVANPGHFLWHTGMRLSELLPERDALLKRDYWWQRTRLGLPTPQLALPAAPEGGIDTPSAVQSPGVQTNWNQAVIERFDKATMTTRLIPFNLGKLVLDHDVSQDVDLMPGDVITIYTQKNIQLPINEQTVYVELDGEFVHPGIYSVSSSETLRSVVTRAGGLTGRAYLFGSTFTRATTRAAEQEQLKEYVDRLERQVEHDNQGFASVASASGQQPTGVGSDQAASLNREMIARLRQMHATGRVVLRMNPQSSAVSELPDMHLEDGDRFVVPFVPETVQVVGAVFNPHAFLYGREARVGEYLRLAGGPNRQADRKRMFVLRADGSVVGHDMNHSLFESDFQRLRLYPGDALIVPEKDARPSALNQLMVWSQFLSQLTLSGLEANSFR